MNNEMLRQRVQYLVTHGGIYPEGIPGWCKYAAVGLVLQIITIAILLLK